MNCYHWGLLKAFEAFFPLQDQNLTKLLSAPGGLAGEAAVDSLIPLVPHLHPQELALTAGQTQSMHSTFPSPAHLHAALRILTLISKYQHCLVRSWECVGTTLKLEVFFNFHIAGFRLSNIRWLCKLHPNPLFGVVCWVKMNETHTQSSTPPKTGRLATLIYCGCCAEMVTLELYGCPAAARFAVEVLGSGGEREAWVFWAGPLAAAALTASTPIPAPTLWLKAPAQTSPLHWTALFWESLAVIGKGIYVKHMKGWYMADQGLFVVMQTANMDVSNHNYEEVKISEVKGGVCGAGSTDFGQTQLDGRIWALIGGCQANSSKQVHCREANWIGRPDWWDLDCSVRIKPAWKYVITPVIDQSNFCHCRERHVLEHSVCHATSFAYP